MTKLEALVVAWRDCRQAIFEGRTGDVWNRLAVAEHNLMDYARSIRSNQSQGGVSASEEEPEGVGTPGRE